jgi:cyclohexanone monooxygenase
VPEVTGTSDNKKAAEALEVLVVGAGFGGMYMLHKLREMGFSVKAFDRAKGVGGTWYWNRYPGARCDVVSLDYSYSFSDQIQQTWTWTEKYAAQPEILAYAEFVARELDLEKDICFETEIVSMHFDDNTSCWHVTTGAGDLFIAQHVIMATGCLSTPKAPDIAGINNFKGEVYFTSRWPQKPVSFAGKNVGLIGTGSTGIQALPELAKQAGRVFVLQRTPSYTLPARNEPLDSGYVAQAKQNYAQRRAEAKNHQSGHLRAMTDRKTFSMDEQERRQRFEDAWRRGGLDMFGEFGDLLIDEKANEEIVRLVHEKIDTLVKNPETAAKLKPRSFPFAGRRICLDTDFYETFNRDNVELIDVTADPIDHFDNKGVVTKGRRYDLDALVLAVGFDAMTGALLAIDIKGRGGRDLREKWSSGPATYLGIAIEGFPNLHMITGPGSPSVLSNMVASIEQHVEWIADLLAHMRKTGQVRVEAEEAAETEWVKYNYDIAKDSLVMKANSWYLGANVSGKPRVFMPYAGGFATYRKICEGIAAQSYRGFRFTDANHHSGGMKPEIAVSRP